MVDDYSFFKVILEQFIVLRLRAAGPIEIQARTIGGHHDINAWSNPSVVVCAAIFNVHHGLVDKNDDESKADVNKK